MKTIRLNTLGAACVYRLVYSRIACVLNAGGNLGRYASLPQEKGLENLVYSCCKWDNREIKVSENSLFYSSTSLLQPFLFDFLSSALRSSISNLIFEP